MDASVAAQGFKPWGGTRPTILNTTFYAEYNSSGACVGLYNLRWPWLTGGLGPGYVQSKRLAAEHILNATEANSFTVDKMFNGKPSWVDWSYVP